MIVASANCLANYSRHENRLYLEALLVLSLSTYSAIEAGKLEMLLKIANSTIAIAY